MKIRKRKWVIYLGILVSLFIIVLFSANSIIKGIVEKEIASQLNNNQNSIYQITYSKLGINVYTGSITIRDLRVKPADSIRKELSDANIKKLLSAEIKVFKIKHINLYQFLKYSKVDISSIIIKNMQVDYYFKTGPKEATNKKTFALQNIFSDKFQGAKINTIDISNTTLRFANASSVTEPIFEIDSVGILINDIELNKETLEESIPISFSDIKINTGHFRLNSSEYYTIKTEGIHFNYQDSSFLINGFALIPNYSKQGFNNKIKYNDDWFSITTQSIKLNHLNISLLKQNQVDINSVEILNPDIVIYRDKRLPDAPFKYKPLLAGIIKKIPIDVVVDTLQIIQGKLTYEEQVDISDQPGMVFFDPLFISAYNITNNPEQIQMNPDMFLVFRGKIMGQSFLNAKFEIGLNRNDEFFKTSGSLEPIAASAFNPFVQNALSVQIDAGEILKTEFNFRANDNESQGSMILNYTDLQVKVLKTKDPEKKSGFISFVANEVIRNNNTEEKKKYLIGNIHFQRRKDKAIVNYIWNSCKTGIISIVAPIADKNKKKEKQAIKEEKKENRKEEKSSSRKN